MGIFFIHILKSSVCLAFLYLCYRLLLSKETFHGFNRITLLSLPIVSLTIPFIEVSMKGVSDISLPFISLEEIILMTDINPKDILIDTPQRFPWNILILSVYASGILFLLMCQGWSIRRIRYLLLTSRKEKMDNNITLYVHKMNVAPFSWMNRIAISEEDLEKNGEAILAHERAHIRYRHSWDLLLAQTYVFFQWFNPAAWLWMNDLKTIHEYEADEWVIRHDMDARNYQLSLIKSVVGTLRFSMANSFNQSLLTKRITMMNKTRSNQWAHLKYLFVLPVAAISVVAFAHSSVVMQNYNFLSGEDLQENKLHLVTEELPEFPGGTEKYKMFINKNCKYPIEAHRRGIHGRVLVGFIVTDDGSIEEPHIIESIDSLLDNEALRIVKMMPKWKPGKQKGKSVNTFSTISVSFNIQ